MSEEPRYTWDGWDEGEDVTPQEPGKKWLTIREDGEEMAIVVVRDYDIVEANQPAWIEQKQAMAEKIVNALNGVTYMVAWTGGYEEPSYAAKPTQAEAFALARDWWTTADEDTDFIDVIKLDTGTGQVERVDGWREVEAE